MNEEKLDKLISGWREEINTIATKDEEKLSFDIDKYNKENKKKKFKDKSAMVALCLAFLYPMFDIEQWSDLIFTSLPFIAITTATVLLIRANKKIKSLDLGLSLVDFQAEELKVLNRECGLLKNFQFFFYPMFAAYALFNVFFRTYEGWEQYVYPLIYAISLAIMIWAYRWGIGKYQEEIDILEKQTGQAESNNSA